MKATGSRGILEISIEADNFRLGLPPSFGARGEEGKRYAVQEEVPIILLKRS